MSDRTTNRRGYLAAVAAATASLAGCSGSSDDEPEDDADGTSDADDTGDSPANGTTNDSEDDRMIETPADGARALVDAMSTGAFEEAVELFSESYRDRVSPGLLENLWLAFTGVGGGFETVLGSEEGVQSGFDAVDLRLGFTRGEHVLRVLTRGDGTVVGAAVNDEYAGPAYADGDAFETRELALESDDCSMDAAVTVPAGADPDAVPGVVLVHGNDPLGTADKNLDAGGTQMFRDLAEGLSSAGVAVFRYDRRTNACPGTIESTGYTLDRVSVADAVAAAERFRTVEGVDPDRVFVVGHSLGAFATPRIVDRTGLAGGVALASPGRSFSEIVVDQLEYLATVGEYDRQNALDQYEVWQDQIERVRAGDYNPGDSVLGYPGAFWDSLSEYDHVETARSIDAPLFYVWGSNDYQVTDEDAALLREELGDRDRTTFRTYDGLNHLFMPVDPPSVQVEYAVRNNVAPTVIEDVAAWVRSGGSSNEDTTASVAGPAGR
ncbi:alpha/beta hydrolase [Halobacteriales archaeon QH_10_67_13]|nr:MAG: alpha/beta hydrolase [Halobacteriales archaeon QH_10_67_13]